MLSCYSDYKNEETERPMFHSEIIFNRRFPLLVSMFQPIDFKEIQSYGVGCPLYKIINNQIIVYGLKVSIGKKKSLVILRRNKK